MQAGLSQSISIPYSSIKSVQQLRLHTAWRQFQFHIVRLKAVHLRIGICLRVISIPYSSIKRKTEENGTENGNVFQFHIVRLKERSGVRQAEREEFQFHIVRLKERT